MVMALQARSSSSFLASDLQASAGSTTRAARPALVQRIRPPCRLLLPSLEPDTDRVGFEPTVPLRAHRFSRPAVSTTHAPVHYRLDAQKTGSDAQTQRR